MWNACLQNIAAEKKCSTIKKISNTTPVLKESSYPQFPSVFFYQVISPDHHDASADESKCNANTNISFRSWLRSWGLFCVRGGGGGGSDGGGDVGGGWVSGGGGGDDRTSADCGCG